MTDLILYLLQIDTSTRLWEKRALTDKQTVGKHSDRTSLLFLLMHGTLKTKTQIVNLRKSMLIDLKCQNNKHDCFTQSFNDWWFSEK